jgi:hypothetical protein
MKLKSLLSVLSVLMVVSLFGVANASAASQATVAVANVATSDMVFSWDGTNHSVPANSQIMLQVAAGTHTYKATVQGWPDAVGKLDLVDGETFSLANHLEKTGPVFDANGTVIDQVLFSPVWVEYLQNDSTRLAAQPVPAGYGGLVLENYIGTQLTVNLGGDSTWIVPVQGRLQFDMPAGQYRLTVSGTQDGFSAAYNAVAQVSGGQYTGLGFNRDLSQNESRVTKSQYPGLSTENKSRDRISGNGLDEHGDRILKWTMLVTNVPLP